MLRPPTLLGLGLLACACASAEPPASQASAAPPAAPALAAAKAPPDAAKVPGPPGVDDWPAALAEKLDAAREAKGPSYEPRTHHFARDGRPKYTNRLILERSPYLLQHAHNPVNWRPWGDEAFAEARRRDVPVLLSVGYSTCHWCHVMEKESFEDETIAELINRQFVAIKVDREERPDVDSIYMKAVNAMTGRGGWPMTVVMTPDRRPFFAGTYFPPRTGARGARKGFTEIITELSADYASSERQALVAKAKQVSQRVAAFASRQRPGGIPGAGTLVAHAKTMAQRFDTTWGGWGRAPKFPRAALIEALLRYHRRTGDPGALRMATLTLDRMAEGGMYDHLGGGFHRYSTDGRWLVPHFEKMLYDNAQLASAYLAAYQQTSKPRYRRVVRETLDYLLREMRSPTGGFYSATDADSEGHEGVFFVWTAAEIDAALGAEKGARFRRYYGVSERGNFEGKNILHTPRPLAEIARSFSMTPGAFEAELGAGRKVLYDLREKREHPLRDDKILAAWNGLLIASLARAGSVLSEPRYLEAAAAAADFVMKTLVVDGRLRRGWLDAPTAHEGFADDYAFMEAACLALFEVTGESRWFDHALRLQRALDERFADPAGGYFYTGSEHESLLAREKPSHDGAVPTGNSVAAENLLRLHHLTLDEGWKRKAEALMRSYGGHLERASSAMPRLLHAVDMDLDRVREVAIVRTKGDDGKNLVKVLGQAFGPNRVIALAGAGSPPQTAIPWLEGKTALGARATAYVCEKGRCERPTSDPKVLAQQLARVEPLPGTKPAPVSLGR